MRRRDCGWGTCAACAYDFSVCEDLAYEVESVEIGEVIGVTEGYCSCIGLCVDRVEGEFYELVGGFHFLELGAFATCGEK